MKASIMILENMLWGVLTQSLFRQKNTLLIKSVCLLAIEMQLGNNLICFLMKFFFSYTITVNIVQQNNQREFK